MAKQTENKGTDLVAQSTALSTEMEELLLGEAGAGSENISMDECSLPILGFVQSNSKIRKDKEACYNPDAKEGQIYDNVSYEVNDRLQLAIAGFKKSYVEWTPGTKGTFVAEHASDSDVVTNAALIEVVENGNTIKRLQTDLGNVLNETYSYMVAYKTPEGSIKMAVLPLKKTMISIARKLNTMLIQTKVNIGGKRITPPTYCMLFEMSSATRSNDKGEWIVPKFEYKGLVSDNDLLVAAKELHNIVKTQGVTAIQEEDELG